MSYSFIQEVIFDWALEMNDILKVEKTGKGLAQKGNSIKERHVNTGCEQSSGRGGPVLACDTLNDSLRLRLFCK